MKSLKNKINIGDIVQLSDNTFHEVTYCGDRDFHCKNLTFMGSDLEVTNKLNYSVGMIVFHEIARNVK